MQLRRLYRMPKPKNKMPKKAQVKAGVDTLCGAKKCYDKKGATIAKIQQSRTSIDKLYIYSCGCGFWHLTSKGRSYEKLRKHREKKRQITAKPFVTKSVI